MRRFPLLMLLVMGPSFVLGVRNQARGDEHSANARVIAAWAAGPFEARISFDRPIAADVARAVVGRPVAFSVARAGAAADLGSLRITSARLGDDGRTLVLTTDPHPRVATYTLELPLSGPGTLTRVAYDLKGVDVTWTRDAGDAMPSWSGWWPTLEPAVVRKQLAGSVEHARALALIESKGRLTLETLITLPKGPAVLTISGSATVEATLNGEAPEMANGVAVFRTESTGDALLLSIALDTGGQDRSFTLKATVKQGTGPETSVVASQLLLPWTPAGPPAVVGQIDVPDLKGGDPRKGAVIFASAEAKCASCHKVRGEGATVGPDLSGFVGRDRKEVYRDIAEPSARIHPDYLPYTVALKDGRVVVGTVRAEGADAIRVFDTEAKVTVVPRAEIEAFRPGSTSVMPVGLAGALGEEKLRDLIAFLTNPAAK